MLVGIMLIIDLQTSLSGRYFSDSLDVFPPSHAIRHRYRNVLDAQSSMVYQSVCVYAKGSTNRSFHMYGTPEKNVSGKFVLLKKYYTIISLLFC